MAGFDVATGELFAAGARVSEAAADGRTSLARLRAEAEQVFAGGWSGAAATAFGQGFHDWLDGAEAMVAGLDDLSTALTSAGHDYEQAEHANVRRPAS